jgi:hypothetical protein
VRSQPPLVLFPQGTAAVAYWDHDEPENIRHRIETSSARRWSSSPPRGSATMSLLPGSIHRARSSANGATASLKNASPALTKRLEAGGQPAFPPSVVVDIKRLACELPSRLDVSLSQP